MYLNYIFINSSSQKPKDSMYCSPAIFSLELSSLLSTCSQQSEGIRNAKYDNANYCDAIRRVTTTLRVLCRLLN